MARHKFTASPEMNTHESRTFLDRLVALGECAENDAELPARIRHIFETRHVRFDRGLIDAPLCAA